MDIAASFGIEVGKIAADPQNLDAPGASAFVGGSCRAGEQNVGDAADLASEILAEEPVGQYSLINVAESLEGEIAKAPADRISHEEGAGEDGGGDGGPDEHRQVNAPMVEETWEHRERQYKVQIDQYKV